MAELEPAAAVASVVDGGDAAAAAAADGTLGKRGAEEAGEAPPAREAPQGAASHGARPCARATLPWSHAPPPSAAGGTARVPDAVQGTSHEHRGTTK